MRINKSKREVLTMTEDLRTQRREEMVRSNTGTNNRFNVQR